MKYIALVVTAALVAAYLALTEYSNFQAIGIVLVVLAALVAFLIGRGKGQPESDNADFIRRKFIVGGGVLGLLGYFGKFAIDRIPTEKMAVYKPSLEPIEIDLKIPAQETFSPRSPQKALADGPYYSLDTPESREISAEGTPGEVMIFQGRVVDDNDQPLDGAIIEIWHADGNGDYDNEGYNCRGHQFTNAQGCFEFHTVKPFGYGKRSFSFGGIGDYRAAHLHVKLVHGDKAQTTQVWFPNDPRNSSDLLHQEASTVNEQHVDGTLYGRFDFVLS